MGFSPRVLRSCQEPDPAQTSHRSQPLLQAWASLHGISLQVDICSTMDLHGLQRDNLAHYGLHHKLQGNFCRGPWSTASASCSFFTDLDDCRVASPAYSHSFVLLQLLLHSDLFLSYPEGTTTITDEQSLVQQWVCLGSGRQRLGGNI